MKRFPLPAVFSIGLTISMVFTSYAFALGKERPCLETAEAYVKQLDTPNFEVKQREFGASSIGWRVYSSNSLGRLTYLVMSHFSVAQPTTTKPDGNGMVTTSVSSYVNMWAVSLDIDKDGYCLVTKAEPYKR